MPHDGNQKIKGAAALLGGAFVVSTFGVWARFVEPMFGTASQTVVRFALAAVLISAFVAVKRKAPLTGYTKKEYAYLFLLAFGSFALGLLFAISVTTTKVTNTFSLLFVASIITSFLTGTLVLRERVTGHKIVAMFIALAGLAMYSPQLLTLNIGLLAGLAAGVCDGLSNAVRKQLRTVDRNVAVLYQYGLAALFTVPVMLLSGEALVRDISLWPVVAMIAYAVVSLAFGKLLLFGFSRFDVNIGAIILATQIFFAMLLGYVIFGEVPSANELLGSLLVFAAIFFAVGDGVRSEIRRLRATPKKTK